MKIKSQIKAIVALLLTGTMLFATSCTGNTNSNNGYLTARPDGNDYSYIYPDSWQTIRSDSMVAIQSQDKQANISSTCYAIDIDILPSETENALENPYATALKNYVEKDDAGYITMLKDNFGEKVNIISAEETSFDEKAGYRLTYSLKIGEDEYYFVTALSLLPTIGSTYLYDITYTALGKEKFDEHIAVFEGVVNSFKFN